MTGRTKTAIVFLVAVLLVSFATIEGAAREADAYARSFEGTVIDLLSAGPIPDAEIRVYLPDGTLLTASASSRDGRWRAEADIPVGTDAVVIQAGSPGHFKRSVFIRQSFYGSVEMKLIPDEIPGLYELAYTLAHKAGGVSRLSRFAPGLDAKVLLLEENPATGERFGYGMLDEAFAILRSNEDAIAKMLGKDDVTIEMSGFPGALEPGLIMIAPDACDGFLGQCYWAYDEFFDVLAAMIIVNSGISNEYALKATLMHEIAHVVFSEDAGMAESILSDIFLLDSFTRLDLVVSLIAHEPSFSAGYYGEAHGPSDWLANMLGIDWGEFIAP